MAATFSITKQGVLGDLQYRVVNATLDNSYATGGYAIATGNIDMTPEHIVFSAVSLSSGGYVGRVDVATKKLVVYYGDNNNAADGPLIEVANGASAQNGEVLQLFLLGKR